MVLNFRSCTHKHLYIMVYDKVFKLRLSSVQLDRLRDLSSSSDLSCSEWIRNLIDERSSFNRSTILDIQAMVDSQRLKNLKR